MVVAHAVKVTFNLARMAAHHVQGEPASEKEQCSVAEVLAANELLGG